MGWASTLQFSTITDGVSDCPRRIVVSGCHEVLLDMVILGLSKTGETNNAVYEFIVHCQCAYVTL